MLLLKTYKYGMYIVYDYGTSDLYLNALKKVAC